MYIPAHFSASEEEVQELLAHLGAADLITSTSKGLLATFLPLLYDKTASRPGTGEFGSLVGHVARANPQWCEKAIGEAMVIARGPDGYISPSWYPSKQEHGRVVPTWNYVTAHIHGRLVIHDDPEWVGGFVRRLTDVHEGNRTAPWSVDDAPKDFIAAQLRAIVGVEIVISRIEAKYKLSQNRPESDFTGVLRGLAETGQAALAEVMPKTRKTV